MHEKWSAEDQQAVERLAKKFGIDLDAADVVGPDATFAGIETAAHRVGQLVARRVCEDLACQQSELIDGPQPCPTCGKRCPAEFRERPLNTGDGPVNLPEPVCHCSACRRDFFPSA